MAGQGYSGLGWSVRWCALVPHWGRGRSCVVDYEKTPSPSLSVLEVTEASGALWVGMGVIGDFRKALLQPALPLCEARPAATT